MTMTKPSLKTRWQNAIADCDNLQSNTRLVLWTLSRFMDKNGGSCFPTIERIMASCKLSNTTVIKHLRLANEAGWISRTPKKTGRDNKSYSYQAQMQASEAISLTNDRASEAISPSQDPELVNPLLRASETVDPELVKPFHTNITENITENINRAFNRVISEIDGLILKSRINTVESLRAFKLQSKDNDPEILASAIIGFYREQKNSDPQYVTGLAKVIREKHFLPFLNAKPELTKALSRELIDLIGNETISENQAYEWQARYERGEVSDLSEFMPLPNNVTPINEKIRKQSM